MATDGPRRDGGPLDRVMGPSPSQYQQSVPSLAGGAATAAGGVSHDMMASLLAAAKRSVAHSLPAAPTPSVSTLLGAGTAGCAPPPDRVVSSYPMPVAAPAAAPVDAPAALALAALSARSPAQSTLWGNIPPALALEPLPRPPPPGSNSISGGYPFAPAPAMGVITGSSLVDRDAANATSIAAAIKGAGGSGVAWSFLGRERSEDDYDTQLLGKRQRAEAAAVGGGVPAAGLPAKLMSADRGSEAGSALTSDGSICSGGSRLPSQRRASGAAAAAAAAPAAGAGAPTDDKLSVTRERNRDHSRKSRLRKKEYITGLQRQVDDLGLYKLLVEQAADPICMNTADDRLTFLYASPGFQRELGYDPVVLREQEIDLVKLVHPENVPALLAQVKKALLYGKAPKVPLRVRHASGRVEAAEASLRLVPGRQVAIVLRLRGPHAEAS